MDDSDVFESPPRPARKPPPRKTSPHAAEESSQSSDAESADAPKQRAALSTPTRAVVVRKRKKSVKPPSGKQKRKAARRHRMSSPPPHEDDEDADAGGPHDENDDDENDGDGGDENDDDGSDENVDEGSDENVDEGSDEEKPTPKPKPKPVDIPAFEAMREQKAKTAGIHIELPRFTQRTFCDSAAALAAQLAYEQEHHCWFRIRNSISPEKWNENNPQAKVTTDPNYLHRRFVLYCTHGCKQPSRSKGIRNHSYTRYTGCQARVTFLLKSKKVKGGRRWWYEIVRETRIHNHNVNPILYSTYKNSTALVEEDLFGKTLDVLIQTNTSTAQIASWMSNATGVPFSTQRVRNILARRLGGPNAEKRLRKLLATFLEIDGNRCALMQDDDGLTLGVIMQSRLQALFFELYGDVLVFDITYNTNNVGFKMGSLIVTGPTGRGIPILDFLTISESKPTLTMVLQWFRDMNPGARNVEAFVVDKSMAEMGAIEDVFPTAAIFLCQFHVKEAVGRALARRVFDLSPSAQADVASRFSDLIYSRRLEDYQQRLSVFREEVGAISPKLLEYFETNWFACREKWSNVGRAEKFSCGNSTTNRVESNWTQIKSIIGDKTGIDRCVSALLQHQLTIFRKLQSTITTAGASSRTFIGVPYFLRPVSTSLSDYALERVTTQHDYFHHSKNEWSASPAACGTCASLDAAATSNTVATSATSNTAATSATSNTAATSATSNSTTTCTCVTQSSQALLRSARVRVNTPYGGHVIDQSGESWTCTCFFYVSQRLPCQHMMYVSQDVVCARTLSRKTVPKRWSMQDFVLIESVLSTCVTAMSGIPLPTQQQPLKQVVVTPTKSKKAQPGLHVVRVKKGARATGPLVVSRNDKRQIMRSELEEVTDRLVALNSSADFYQWVERLHDYLEPFLQALRDNTTTQEQGTQPECFGTDSESVTDGSDELEGPMSDFPPDTTDERECRRARPLYPCPPDSDCECGGGDEAEDTGGGRAQVLGHDDSFVPMEEGYGYDVVEGPVHGSVEGPVHDSGGSSAREGGEGPVPMDTTRMDIEDETNTDVGEVDAPSQDSNDSEDYGFEYESGRELWVSSEHSSHDSVNYDTDASDMQEAVVGAPVGGPVADPSANMDFSPSEVSLPDLDLSASSLAILGPLSGSSFTSAIDSQPAPVPQMLPSVGAPTPGVAESSAAVGAAPSSVAAVAPTSVVAVAPTSRAAPTTSVVAVAPTTSVAVVAPTSVVAVAPTSVVAVAPTSVAVVAPTSVVAVAPTSRPTSVAVVAPTSRPTSVAVVAPTSRAAATTSITVASSRVVPTTSVVTVAQSTGWTTPRRTTLAPPARAHAAAPAVTRGAVTHERRTSVAAVALNGNRSGAQLACTTCTSTQFEICALSGDAVCVGCGTTTERTSQLASPTIVSPPRTLPPLPSQEVVDVSSGDTSDALLFARVARINAGIERRKARNRRLALNLSDEEEEKQSEKSAEPASPRSNGVSLIVNARSDIDRAGSTAPTGREKQRRTQLPTPAPAGNKTTGLHILNVPKPPKGFSKKDARKQYVRRQIQKDVTNTPLTPTANVQEFNFWTRNTHDIMEVHRKHASYTLFTPVRRVPQISTAPFAPPGGMHAFTLDLKTAQRFKSALEDYAKEMQAAGAPVEGDMANPFNVGSDAEDDQNAAQPTAVTVVKVGQEDTAYSRWYVDEVLLYHKLKESIDDWAADRKWLMNFESKSEVFIDLFRAQSIAGRFTPVKSLLTNVRNTFNQQALTDTFHAPRAPKRSEGDTLEITFEAIVGRIAGKTLISDAALYFLLNKVTELRSDVVDIDPHPHVKLADFKPPVDDVKTISFLIQPISVGRHWILLVVEFDWPNSSAHGHIYDPVMADSSIKMVKNIFNGEMQTLIDSWLQRKYEGDSLDQTDTTVCAGPVQPEHDGYSCGFLCLLVAYFIINKLQFSDTILRGGSFTDADMDLLRLKALHLILVNSTRAPLRHTTRQIETIEKVGSIMRATPKNGP